MLTASDITVRIGAATLLRQVSFNVSPGEVVAIVGPNGAGKSTLLKILSGVLAGAEGRASLDGRPLAGWPRLALARRRAVLSQKIELTLPFTALEVVLLGRAPWHGVTTRDEDIAVALAAMRGAGVTAFASRIYTSLSGGEQQRVHLARVLAQLGHSEPAETGGENGRYLLLDEPTASLDLAHQHATLGVARRHAEAGLGVVAVLHDLNLAAMHADRLVLMKSGRIVATGAPEAVLTAAQLESVFELPVAITRHPTRGCLQVAAA